MWFFRRILTNESSGADESATAFEIYLRQGTHVVGRQKSKCTIVLPDDPELSRQHATIRVRYSTSGPGGVYLRDGVSIEKPSSSSGTFLNREKVTVNWSSGDLWQPIHPGDHLVFGRKYTFELCLLEKKLRIASSRVGKDETVAVRQQIAALGAQYTKVWKNLETDCLVMGTFSSTFKAVSAIAFGKPVVSTKWLKNISHVREHRDPRILLESIEDCDLPLHYTKEKADQAVSRAHLFASKTFISLMPPSQPGVDYLTLAEQRRRDTREETET